MSGVDPRVDATMWEPRGVAGRAAKEQGPTPSQPERADITFRREIFKCHTTAGKRRIRTNMYVLRYLAGTHPSPPSGQEYKEKDQNTCYKGTTYHVHQ
jgi:hypothetical protein